MKTDKFEKTIRQKLESISPDFQETDWAKMQNYMHVHTPPTLWQQYGSWLGYAAAASVTSVMAFMYVNQLSQNNKLSNDVKSLQNQITIIKEKPAETPKTDTIYIVRDAVSTNSESPSITYRPVEPEGADNQGTLSGKENSALPADSQPDGSGSNSAVVKSQSQINPDTGYERQIQPSNKGSFPVTELANNKPENAEKLKVYENTEVNIVAPAATNNTKDASNLAGATNIAPGSSGYDQKYRNAVASNTVIGSKTLGANFENISTQTPISSSVTTEQMSGALMNRLSAKQIRKTWMASTANTYKAPTSAKKTEQTTQAENVIPQLNLKVPYRFGAGMEWQKDVQTKTVMGEVLIAKRFSISAGLSWLKLKQMQFFNEKGFREANKRDFKQTHPNEVPAAFVVTNIQIEPTMMQIPLTVAFRNDLKDNWAYFVGAGANITLKSNEKISYSCIIPKPKQEILTQSFDRKMDISPINSLNFSLGIEKSWHPIVVQAEGYIYSYFKPLTPVKPRSGPGFKVKLLYQIGKKM
jgi:hypothetical protein